MKKILKDSEKFPSTFCDLFRLQVQKNPQAVAVKFKDQSLTYEELDAKSTQLAGCLKIRGLRTGQIVALAMYNCLDLITAILGIFKSGGVYLPIDPNYPHDRIEAMLKDAQPHFLITKSPLKTKFSEFCDRMILTNELFKRPFEGLLHPVPADSSAYIVYTSGSTGKPKGIVVAHSALSHAALAYQDLHPERHHSLMIGSISFDPSLLIIVYTLSTGGTLCLPQNKTGIDPKHPKEIIELIHKYSISLILCTPLLYSKIIHESPFLASLRSVDLCGENIPKSLPNSHANIAPNAFLYNLYGPFEYAMGSTAAKIYDPYTKKINEITVGRPFSNNKVYILNENFNEVLPGEKGEIFLGGPGLAKKYLNLESLTEKRFLRLSLPMIGSVRLYRSGDYGYFRSDGNIIFLGRSDRQKKILGHRVELDEIEHVISLHPKINKAVVTVYTDQNNQDQLIAFYSTTIKEDGELKEYLQKKLPFYMIPSKFIQVSNWPYNQNGKIDQIALKKKYSMT